MVRVLHQWHQIYTIKLCHTYGESSTLPQKKHPSFEEALKKLEEIVQKMESGELSLQDSLKAYEEGHHLKHMCESYLKDAKVRIEKIQSTDPLVTEDFQP